MANNRTQRDQETRENNPTRYVYKPPSALPDPTPELTCHKNSVKAGYP